MVGVQAGGCTRLSSLGKCGGQALIEEDSSVLVTSGAQDSGIPLLK